MSNDKKNAFSEKTVVQTRQSFDAEPVADEKRKVTPVSGDKTVVFAQSNLQETFDARTVVRPAAKTATSQTSERAKEPSKEPAKETKKESAKTTPPPVQALTLDHVEAPPVVTPAAVPAKAKATDMSNEVTNPGVRTETSGSSRTSPDEPKKKTLSQNEKRAQRAALDRKTRTMFAALATLCALVVLCLVVALGGPKSSDKAATNQPISNHSSETTELASETQSQDNRAPGVVGEVSTTDVLMKFDRAAQNAQEQALDYSKPGSGF